MTKPMSTLTALVVVALTLTAGCLGGDDDETPKLVQTGSSTVLPVAMAWAEEYDGADITVSGGGSSHGFNALLNGEADLGDASRVLKGKDYDKIDSCDGANVNSDGTVKVACNGVMPHKWVVAYDVLAVVVNNDNDWATQLNYTQLYKIFTDDDPADYWDEVPGLENSSAPHQKIEIYAPDEASGTYDFFFENIIPKWGKDDQQAGTRLESDDGAYNPSADDNVILDAIKASEYAIGYFGFAYYHENQDKVATVDIWNDYDEVDENYVEASFANVATYPMARPLYIYTDENSAKRDVVGGYLEYVFSDAGQAINMDVGYVPVGDVSSSLLNEQRTAAAEY